MAQWVSVEEAAITLGVTTQAIYSRIRRMRARGLDMREISRAKKRNGEVNISYLLTHNCEGCPCTNSLHREGEYTYKEIADILGMSVNEVLNLERTAIKKLRENKKLRDYTQA
jgi:DNA-directed RNA polymerase specialized sigma24 family protein